MRAWSVLAAAILLLAGCAETSDTENTTDLETEDTTDLQEPGEGNATLPNLPPAPSLSADVLNGTAPLSVNFTIDATDNEQDNLTWVISVNGTGVANGTEFPATFLHVFDAGNHTVNLTVSDGTLSNGTDLLVVASLPDAGAAFDPIEHSGWITIPCNQCFQAADMDLCVGLQTGTQEVDCVWFELPAEAAGREYTTTSTGDDADIAFYSTCATGNQIDFVGQTGHDEGIVPEGAGCVVMTDWLIPDSELSITIV